MGDADMSRLIIVPQYPTKLRYQEWWYSELPRNYSQYFDKVIVLGSNIKSTIASFSSSEFSPVEQAIKFEMQQINEYLDFQLCNEDVLLLCDISFPGLFGQALFHKRPRYCYAICHATSKNKYDYFAGQRKAKWGVESGMAKLFDKIFVATNYHKDKLKWKNAVVTGLPLPPTELSRPNFTINKYMKIVSVARGTLQKRNKMTERFVEGELDVKIETPNVTDWRSYYQFLAESKVMLITAREETFGYQVVDAILNQCTPVAPNKYSYPELLSREYLYSNNRELVLILSKALRGGLPQPKLLIEQTCKNFFEMTSRIMLKRREGECS